jgi:hypothetical protein
VLAGAAASDEGLVLIHNVDECSHSIQRERRRLVCTAAIWVEVCRHLNPFARPGNTFRPATTLLCGPIR